MTLTMLGGESLSRDAFRDRFGRVATALLNEGLREGDSVALLLRNDLTFLEVEQAAAITGVQAVPLNWHNAPEETLYVLNDCGAKIVVAHSDLYLSAGAGAFPPGFECWFCRRLRCCATASVSTRPARGCPRARRIIAPGAMPARR